MPDVRYFRAGYTFTGRSRFFVLAPAVSYPNSTRPNRTCTDAVFGLYLFCYPLVTALP